MNDAKQIVRRRINSGNQLPDDMHPVLRRVYAARGVNSTSELDYALGKLGSFEQLKGMPTAVALLEKALREAWRIVIVADFDADGATSCALALRGLRALGANDVHYIVPNRFEYGYGLTPEIVTVAAQLQPQLLVTVDNGIASLEGVEEAKRLGLHVLVTDHHLPGKRLPDADAIVNPNQPGDEFPSKCLAGVGVMFYVLMALRARLRQTDWFQAQQIDEPNLAQYLDLVALGTVADVVPLDFNNRILVSQGLARIRAGRCQWGIRALARFAKRDLLRLSATDMAFAIGPRLNAAGRLTDMSLGIECLLADDEKSAEAMAEQLDQLNHERRAIEAQMQEQAMQGLANLHLENEAQLPVGLCLYNPQWHQGVIGILASRIKERFHRPVIVFADAHHGAGDGELKGSARSVAGVHIRDVLDSVATSHPGLIRKFGGHAMAAGLSLAADKLADFKASFDAEVRRHLSSEDLQGVLHSDGQLDVDDFCISLAEALAISGPWGQAFPEPLFDGRFLLLSRRTVGEKHLKLTVRLDGSGQVLDAIAFNASDEDWPNAVEKVAIAYRLGVNVYRGQRNLQLVVEHVQPLS